MIFNYNNVITAIIGNTYMLYQSMRNRETEKVKYKKPNIRSQI